MGETAPRREEGKARGATPALVFGRHAGIALALYPDHGVGVFRPVSACRFLWFIREFRESSSVLY